MSNLKNKKYKILATKEMKNFEYLKKIVGLEQNRMKKLSEIGELTKNFFIDKLEYETELLRWKKVDLKMILENLKLSKNELEKIQDVEFVQLENLATYNKEKVKPIPTGFTKENLEKILMDLTKKTGVGDLLWPLRVALIGQKFSPGPFEIAEILGKKKCLERIDLACKKITINN
jgi:glutamyl/glutaminyl-tRNA synthetase